MSSIFTDLERGAVVLVHDLTEAPTDGAQLPEQALAAVEHLADAIGLDKTKLGAAATGWLFDRINDVIEGISSPSEGHAAADAQPAAPPAAAPAAPASAPDTAPISEPTDPPAAPAAPAAAPAAPVAPVEPPANAEAATAAGPVTEAPTGQEICGECNGFRTVIVGGVVELCPRCHGAGLVPTGGNTPAAA